MVGRAIRRLLLPCLFLPALALGPRAALAQLTIPAGGACAQAYATLPILMGLLLPAVQLAREEARRAPCGNNLKQMGFEAHESGRNYIDLNGNSILYLAPERPGSAPSYVAALSDVNGSSCVAVGPMGELQEGFLPGPVASLFLGSHTGWPFVSLPQAPSTDGAQLGYIPQCGATAGQGGPAFGMYAIDIDGGDQGEPLIHLGYFEPATTPPRSSLPSDDAAPVVPYRAIDPSHFGETPPVELTMESGEYREGRTPPDLRLRPRLLDFTPVGFVDRPFCACGRFPDPVAQANLRIDGIPLGIPATASESVLWFRLPPGVSPGPHVVSGDPNAGYTASDEVDTTVLALEGTIDRDRLGRGESTELRVRVLGSDDPFEITLENTTPDIIRLVGGDRQMVRTGGDDNAASVRVDAVSPGDFGIDYDLARQEPCPCAAGAAIVPAAPANGPVLPAATPPEVPSVEPSGDSVTAEEEEPGLPEGGEAEASGGSGWDDLGAEGSASIGLPGDPDPVGWPSLPGPLSAPAPETPPETPEELCSARQVAGRLAPTQGVWQDDPSFEDRPGKRITAMSPRVLWAELPMVAGRRTVLTGVERLFAGEPGSRDEIVLTGRAGGSRTAYLKLRFVLEQNGSSRVVHESGLVAAIPLGGPCQGGGPGEPFRIRLPATLGVPDPGEEFTLEPGPYTIRVVAVTEDGRETEIEASLVGSAVRVRPPTVRFQPVVLFDLGQDLTPFERRVERVARDVATRLQDVWPIPHGPVPTTVAPTRVMEGLLERLRSRPDWREFRRLLKEELIREELSRRLQAGAAMGSADRTVVMLRDGDYRLLTVGPLAPEKESYGWAPSRKVVFIDVDGRGEAVGRVWRTVAHELVHTIDHLFSSDEMTDLCGRDYHGKEDGVGNGLRLTEAGAPVRTWHGKGLDMMESSSGPLFGQCTWWNLLRELQGGAVDPPVRLVQGFVNRGGGEPEGRLLAGYAFDGFDDLPAGEGGDWAIVLKDDAGDILARHPFEPLWSVPDLEVERELVGFVHRVVDAPGTRRIELTGPGGTLLDARDLSASDPRVRIAEAARRGDMVRLAWTAADPDSDALLSTVLYSPDGGGTWTDVAFETEATAFEFRIDPADPDPVVRVRVTDGARSADDERRPAPSAAPSPGG